MIADELDAMAERFDGLKGELVAAAIRMFISASPQKQREALTAIMTTKVQRLFEGAKTPPIGIISGRPAAKESSGPQGNPKGSAEQGAGQVKDR